MCCLQVAESWSVYCPRHRAIRPPPDLTCEQNLAISRLQGGSCANAPAAHPKPRQKTVPTVRLRNVDRWIFISSPPLRQVVAQRATPPGELPVLISPVGWTHQPTGGATDYQFG